jgi:hypothetical protein
MAPAVQLYALRTTESLEVSTPQDRITEAVTDRCTIGRVLGSGRKAQVYLARAIRLIGREGATLQGDDRRRRSTLRAVHLRDFLYLFHLCGLLITAIRPSAWATSSSDPLAASPTGRTMPGRA